MVSLSDDDLELWLSRYLDNELEAAEKEAVEAKLRNDEKWRAEFEDLQLSDTSLKVVAIKYHDNEEFTKHVTSKLKPVATAPQKATGAVAKAHAKTHVSHRRLPAGRRSREGAAGWVFGIAALVALTIGAVVFMKLESGRGGNALETPNTGSKAAGIVVTEDVRAIGWPDGSQILARRGSVVTAMDDRALKLSGEAYFQIAKNARPFTVIINDKQKVQALGTRFEIKNSGELTRVRVAEGVVKVQGTVGADQPRTVEARGGTEVLPDMRTRQFDARELSLAWNQAGDVVAPWPQAGGSAGHSGITPLNGPANLVKKRELFIPYPEKCETPAHGAVLGAGERAYIVARCAGEVKLLELKLDGKSTWTTCITNAASPEISPVITPRGLVLSALLDGTVTAYDPAAGKTMWTFSEKAGLRGLCAAPDETVLLSTNTGLTAVDGREGKTLWRCAEAKELTAAATVLASGLICAVSESGKVYVIDAGKLVNTYIWPRAISQPSTTITAAAPSSTGAAGSADQVWLTSADGFVARMAMDKGSTVEKYFGWQLKCGPIGTGLLGHSSMVMHFDQPAAVTAPAEDTVMALVADKRNEVFAGYRRGVLHVKAPTPGEAMAQMKETDFANLAPAAGEIIRNGMAIAPGKLVVTTTKGLQIFE